MDLRLDSLGGDMNVLLVYPGPNETESLISNKSACNSLIWTYGFYPNGSFNMQNKVPIEVTGFIKIQQKDGDIESFIHRLCA